MAIGSRQLMTYINAQNNASPVINQVSQSLQTLEAHGASLNVKMFAMGLVLTKVGRQFQAAGKSILGFAQDSVQAAMDYDSSMRRVATLTEIPIEAFPRLKEQVLALTRAIPKTAEEMGDAMYFIASVINEPDEALKLLEISAKAATLAMGSTEPVAKTLSSAMIAYGGTTKDAAIWGDQLTKAVSVGRAEFDDFAGQIGKLIGMSNTLGITFKELNVWMAFLTRRGFTASQAQVMLNNTMMKIIKPAAEAKKKYKELGLAWGEAAISKAGGLIPFLQQLGEKVKWNADTLAILFPNVRNLPLLLSMAKDAAKGTAGEMYGMQQALASTSGEIDKRFAIAMEGAANQIQIFKNMIQELKIMFGNVLLPEIIKVLKPLVKYIREAVEWFDKLPQKTKTMIAKLVVFGGIGMTVFGTLLVFAGQLLNIFALLELAQLTLGQTIGMAFSPFTAAFNLAKKVVVGISTGFSKIIGILGNFGKAVVMFVIHPIKSIGSAVVGLKGVFSTLAAPLVALKGAIVGVVQTIGGMVARFGFFTTIKMILVGVSSAFASVAAAVLPVIAAILALVGAVIWLKDNWDKVKESATAIWENLRKVIDPIITRLKDQMIPLWEALKDAWDQIKPVALFLGKILLGVLVVALGLIVTVITSVVGALEGLIKAFKGVIKIVEGVFQIIRGLGDIIIGIFTLDWDKIVKGWDKIKAGAQKVVDGVVQVFAGLWDSIKGAIQGAWDGFLAFFTGLWEGLSGKNVSMEGVEKGIKKWFSDLGSKITNWFKDAWNAIKNWFNETAINIGVWIIGWWNAFINFFTQLPGKITTWLANAWTSFVTWLQALPGNIAYWLGYALGAFIRWGIDTLIAINNWAVMTWDRIVQWCIDAYKAVVKWVADTLAAFAKFVVEAPAKIAKWASDTKAKIIAWTISTLTKIGEWIINTKAKIIAWANETVANLKTWATNAVAAIVRFVKEAPGKIVEFVKNVGNALAKLPGEIAKWISKAIDALWELLTEASKLPAKLWSKAKEIGKKFWEGFKKGLFGSPHPKPVYALWEISNAAYTTARDVVRAGKQMRIGLQAGLGDAERYATRTMAALGSTLTTGLNTAAVSTTNLANNVTSNLMPVPVQVTAPPAETNIIIKFHDETLRGLIEVESQKSVYGTFNDVALQDIGR